MTRTILRSCLLILIVSLYLPAALAEREIKVLGLFTDKILLSVDGTNKVLRVGERYQGIELISADSKKCTIKHNNQVQNLTLGTDMRVQFRKDENAVVRIRKDEQGMYRVGGKINNQSVNFLVDTGATQLAMNMGQAEALNLELTHDTKVPVDTASGKAHAFQVTLRKVSVGEITVYDVPALVVHGDAPKEVLLGMSFLKRVEMDDENTVLELRKRY